MLPMPMSARRWRNQRSQSLDHFERREHQADAAAESRPYGLIEQALGKVAGASVS